MTVKKGTGFRKGAGLLIAGLLVLSFPARVQAADRLQDVGDKLVVVIDPGHGGENEGTTENGYLEKAMTLTTAMAMYERLSLYDDVEIHMTRMDDVDLTLAERAEYAASVEADFLFSIHYNASENHELFGSEVWVSSLAPFNGYGYQVGCELLTDMRSMGLWCRGVKTRLNSKGENYYGIIRESQELEIPAVIIEHCHVDEERDAVYCDSQEKLEMFGRLDADAAARYFGLKSSSLGVDYSGYSLADASFTTEVPVTVKDSTPPDICEIEYKDADYATGFLGLTVTAADYDSPLLYYSYSIDGGKTFSQREAWPESDALTGSYPDTFTLNLEIPSGETPTVILRAYNMYDLYTESNSFLSLGTFYYGEPEEAVEAAGVAQADDGQETEAEADLQAKPQSEPESGAGEEGPRQVSFLVFLEICLVVVFLLFILLLVSQAIDRHNKKRRRQRRNAAGENRNQHR